MLKQTVIFEKEFYPFSKSSIKITLKELSPAGVRAILVFKESMRSLPKDYEFHIDEHGAFYIGISSNNNVDIICHVLSSVLLGYCLQAGLPMKEIEDVMSHAYDNNMWLELSEDETYYNFVG